MQFEHMPISWSSYENNRSKPLTIITKNSTLDVAAVLDPPLNNMSKIIHYTFCFLRYARVRYVKSLFTNIQV